MSASSTVLLRLVIQLVVYAALCLLIADAFILQELPLYRTDRNYDNDAFDRPVRGTAFKMFRHRVPYVYNQYGQNA